MSQGITYETAKKLKDAGFPQQNTHLQGSWHGAEDIEKELCYNPTLSELIEACGEPFRELKTIDIKWWYATAGDYRMNSGILGAREYMQGGATPEEAVANLYLTLHPLTNSKEEGELLTSKE